MGSLENNRSDPPSKPPHNLDFTQPFDSQLFTGDGVDDMHIEIAAETQKLDLYDETQPFDFHDDESDVKDSRFDQFDTQLFDGVISDDETQVIDDSDDDATQTDVDSGRRQGLFSTSQSPTVQVSKEQKPDSAPRFTSVRAAAFRASGLAARRKSLEGNNIGHSSLPSSNQCSEEDAVKNNGSNTQEVADKGRYNDDMRGLMGGDSSDFGRSTMRKLFDEDCENERPASSSSKALGGEEMLQLPAGDDGQSGLSYVDSQEPGELSQANALACVQRLIEENEVLIEENKVLYGNEFDLGARHVGKLNLVSTSKGSQSLAKKTTDRWINKKTGVFDWDDKREDDGGGDIFQRRKEEFFGVKNLGQRSLSMFQNTKRNVQNEKAVLSDSKLVLDKLKLNEKTELQAEIDIRKNLVSAFNGQSNQTTLTGQLAGQDVVEIPDVGLDTQMAAEAMEALFNGDGTPDYNGDGILGDYGDLLRGSRGKKGQKNSHSKRESFDKDCNSIGVSTRQSKRIKSGKQSSVSNKKHSKTARNECDVDLTSTRDKGVELVTETLRTAKRRNVVEELQSKMAEEPTEKFSLDEDDIFCGTASTGSGSVKRRKYAEEHVSCTPIACRTRKALVTSESKNASNGSREKMTRAMEIDAVKETGAKKDVSCPPITRRTRQDLVSSESNSASDNSSKKRIRAVEIGTIKETKAHTTVEPCIVLDAKGKSSDPVSMEPGEPETSKTKLTMGSGMSFPRRRRSTRLLPGQPNEPSDLDSHSKSFDLPVNTEKASRNSKKPRSTVKIITLAQLNAKRRTRSSTALCPDLPSVRPQLNEAIPVETIGKSRPDGDTSSRGREIPADKMAEKKVGLPNRQNSVSSEHKVNTDNLSDLTEPSKSKCVSPVTYIEPVNGVSPVCVGDESSKRLFQKSPLMREISGLCATRRELISSPKDSRKRRELANVRVMFSRHLDADLIKQQRKILDRLKVPAVSSIKDATHFVADEFVRTRNMLEAIASGKPVVTHLWLEDIGLANYYIDEQKYILRDSKKEKEFVFNLPVSLSNARRHPLLEGLRVLITPKTKPSKEILSGLVKAVSGQALERVGRSVLKEDTIPDDLLILSCEEDYEICVPFLKKGAAVYSSELLLNGIVIQRLEYERHQLFTDHVKKTRSTIWLKEGNNSFTPVTA